MKIWMVWLCGLIRSIIVVAVIVVLLPVFTVLSLIVLIGSGWPILYKQKRIGYKGKSFWMYKFRTMKNGADRDKKNYINFNEADGPVFKIKDDPRFTKVGKYLCHSGLDELPQFLNILKGDMTLIGPRPLPVEEEKKIPKKYKKIRQSVPPGIISTWVLDGYHKISFKEWMEHDLLYIHQKSFKNDFYIFIKGFIFFIKLIIEEIVVVLKKIFYANGVLKNSDDTV